MSYLTSGTVLYFIILSFSWFIFVSLVVFTKQVQLFDQAVLSMVGLVEHEYHVATRYFLGSPRGVIVTAWFDLTIILTVLGLVCMWFIEKKSARVKVWTFMGSFSALLLLFWILAPSLSVHIHPDRLWLVSYLVLFSFVAYILLKFDRRVKGILIVFLLLNLPINMMLTAPDNLALFHSPYAIPAWISIKQSYVTQEALSTAQWINVNLPSDQAISVDERGHREMFFARNKLERVSYPHFAIGSSYIVFTHFYIKHNLWMVRIAGGVDFALTEPSNQSIASPRADLLYNNGYQYVLWENS